MGKRIWTHFFGLRLRPSSNAKVLALKLKKKKKKERKSRYLSFSPCELASGIFEIYSQALPSLDGIMFEKVKPSFKNLTSEQ